VSFEEFSEITADFFFKVNKSHFLIAQRGAFLWQFSLRGGVTIVSSDAETQVKKSRHIQ
jgi:hypothetical protein